MPEPSEIEAMLAGDGEIGRDALKFLEVGKATDKARNDALVAVTQTGGGEAQAAEGDAEETQAEEAAGVEDPQGELETREDPAAEEVQAAGLRQADYTRKMQAVAERARALEAQEQAIAQKLGTLDAAVAQAEAVLARVRPDPRVIAEMEAVDPGKAALEKLKHIEAQQALATARAQRDRIAAEQAAARVAREADALMTAVPAFRDPETGEFNEALYAKVGAHAKKLGLPAERWGEVIDAPLVRAMYDSMQSEAKAAKAKGVQQALKTAPRVLRPGASGAPGARSAASSAGVEQRAAAALAARPNSTEAIAARFLARDQANRAKLRGPRVGGA